LTHTSVRLPEDLDSQARKLCAEQGISFASFIQLAVRNQLQNNAWAVAEKRQAAAIGTINKKIDQATKANRAVFSLVFALGEHLLSRIYIEPTDAEAQMEDVVRVAQKHYGGSVKDFLGEEHGK